MKRKIKRVLNKLIDKLPKKYILFESMPDYSDNSLAVYQYMKKDTAFNKYKLIWLDYGESSENVTYRKVKANSRLASYYRKRSAAIVFCNRTFSKCSDKQKTFFLCHGSKSKKTRGRYGAPENLDYILVQAPVFHDVLKYEYSLSNHTQLVTLGYPRNDDLLAEIPVDFRSSIQCDYDKLIVWYPTFRQHNSGALNVSSITLPIMHNQEDAEKINDCAKQNRVLIVLKPHFAQDVSYIQSGEYTNLKIINDDFLKDNQIRSYQMLRASDALITDYSSVYYDYLLRDKPIGLVWEDYAEYKQNQGFAMDPDMIYSGGEKIYNVDDICAFICRIANGEDVLCAERDKIKHLTNVYTDANSSERVAKFIWEVLNSKSEEKQR